MLRSRNPAFCIAILVALPGPAAFAQPLDVTFSTDCPANSEAACFGAATVMGLNPKGDGFLAVRSGPGSSYRQIGMVHNGDRIGTYGRKGDWYAISFGPNNQLGWAHGNWLGDHVP